MEITIDISLLLSQVASYNALWEGLFIELEAGYTGSKTNPKFTGPLQYMRNELINLEKFYQPTKRLSDWIDNTATRSKITLTYTTQDLYQIRSDLLGDQIDQFVSDLKRAALWRA